LVTITHKYEMAYGRKNDNVIDDVT